MGEVREVCWVAGERVRGVAVGCRPCAGRGAGVVAGEALALVEQDCAGRAGQLGTQ